MNVIQSIVLLLTRLKRAINSEEKNLPMLSLLEHIANLIGATVQPALTITFFDVMILEVICVTPSL